MSMQECSKCYLGEIEVSLHIIELHLKWHILSQIAGLKSNYFHFYGRTKMSKNNGIQTKAEDKIAFPANLREYTFDPLVFNRRSERTTIRTWNNTLEHLNYYAC